MGPSAPEWKRTTAGGRSQVLTFVLGALLVIAGVAAYSNSFSGVMVFDDLPGIRDNVTIRKLWPLTAPLSPPANSGLGGRPLANLSFAINYALSGTDVRGYHLGNVLLHVGSALLLFGILRRTWSAAPISLAWVTALIWTLHPLTTASVSYLSQRTEVLMGFFYLLTLFALVRAAASNSRRWLTLSVIACALGMMSKEVMITAPVVALLYDRTFLSVSFAALWRRRSLYYLGLASTWLVLGYLLTTGLAQRSVGYGLGISLWQYALTECWAVLLYIKLAFWPAPLVFDYGRVYSYSIAGSVAIGAALAVVFGWSVRGMFRRSAAGFAGVCFFLLLAPTSSIIPVADQPIAENRTYLPVVVASIFIAGSLYATLGQRFRFLLLPVALVLSMLTLDRNRIFHSPLMVWTDTVQKRPENPRAHFNRGVVLLDGGQRTAAIRSFTRTVQLAPDYAEAHDSLGNALLQLGQVREAISHYAEAVRIKPNYPRAWYNLGAAHLRDGDVAAAVADLEQSLRLAPDFPAAHVALGNAHFERNEPARAIPHYEHALRLDPQLADAHYNCGNAFLALDKLPEAMAHLAALVRLKPTDPEARNAYGGALLRAGKTADAIVQFERALELKPEYTEARSNLELAHKARNR